MKVVLLTMESKMRSYKSVADHVEVAKKLASEHGGEVPNPGWLVKNGYVSLYAAMRNHPEAFAEVTQRVVRARGAGKTLAEHVADAERLAAANGGVLPSSAWRVKNGFASLNREIKAHPEAFAHLTSAKQTAPVTEETSVTPVTEETSPFEVVEVVLTPVGATPVGATPVGATPVTAEAEETPVTVSVQYVF